MNEQRQHGTRHRELNPGADDPGAVDSVARLTDARDHLSRIFAAIDSRFDAARVVNSERFLEQMRQTGGE